MHRVFRVRATSIVICSLVAAQLSHVQFLRHRAAQPHGKFTQSQILNRSLPLCGALCTDSSSVSLTASPERTWESGRPDRFWLVDAYDNNNRYRAHLMWEADTGELMTVSRATRHLSERAGKAPMPRLAAQKITASWLTTLGIYTTAAHWRAETESHVGIDPWRIVWRSGTRIVAVTIDSQSGDLISAQTVKPDSEAVRTQVAMRATVRRLQRL